MLKQQCPGFLYRKTTSTSFVTATYYVCHFNLSPETPPRNKRRQKLTFNEDCSGYIQIDTKINASFSLSYFHRQVCRGVMFLQVFQLSKGNTIHSKTFVRNTKKVCLSTHSKTKLDSILVGNVHSI